MNVKKQHTDKQGELQHESTGRYSELIGTAKTN